MLCLAIASESNTLLAKLNCVLHESNQAVTVLSKSSGNDFCSHYRVSGTILSLSPPACIGSFSVVAEIAVCLAAIALVPCPQTTHVAHLCLFTRPRSTYQATEQSGRCRQTSGNTSLTSNRLTGCGGERKRGNNKAQERNKNSDFTTLECKSRYKWQKLEFFGTNSKDNTVLGSEYLLQRHHPSYWFFSSRQSHMISFINHLLSSVLLQ